MKASDLWKWICENKLEESEVYVNREGDYEEIGYLWESEANGGSVIIEAVKNPEK